MKIKACNALNAMFVETIDIYVTGYPGTSQHSHFSLSVWFWRTRNKHQAVIMGLLTPGAAKYHISVVFSVKLLLKLIWLKVSSAFNLGQRQQWNFPSLSCGA